MAEENRTEQATPKKKQDERKKGNVFQSKDVTSVAVLLLSFVIVSKLCGFVGGELGDFYTTQINRIGYMDTLTVSGIMQIFRESVLVLFICAFPLMGVVCLAAVAANGIQTRFNFSMERLKPKLSKINPLEGIKRIISIRSGVQLLKSILKVVVISVVIYSALKGVLIVAPDMLATDISESTDYMLGRMMSMVYKICIMFIAIAVLDWAYERFDYEKRMRMTKQEVKEEYKQTEGDPQIKGKQKERMRKMSMNRMIQAIPTADVIVKNPTHIAVALRYDPNEAAAPIVVAKGLDNVAARILREGAKYNIPTYEDRPLAHTLYYERNLDPGMMIPQLLYEPVVKVFVWLMENNLVDKDKFQSKKAVS